MAIRILQRIFDNFKKEEILDEGTDEKKKVLSLTMSNEDLLKEIDKDIQRAMPLYKKMKLAMDENENYYLGNQLDQSLFTWELPTAENLLYMATETIISIMASQRKEPIVMAGVDTDEAKKLAEKTQKFLAFKWGDEDMEVKCEDWMRHSMIYKIGVLRFSWDLKRDDFEVKLVRPQKVLIDPDATDEDDAKFIIEYQEDALEDLKKMFPKADLSQFGKEMGTIVKYIQYSTNDLIVWKVNNLILDKRDNPFWNWDEDRKETWKKFNRNFKYKGNKKLKNVLLNYFDEPKKPYIILSLKSLGKTIYSDTTDFEQGKIIQDIVNKRKRQIDRAAVKSLGREVFSGSFIDKNEAKKAESNPNAPLWVQKGKAQDAVGYIASQPISPVIFNDLQESKIALDNVMGTHGTTRGERGAQETATGRNILRQGDYGRIDLMMKRVDNKLVRVYEWMMQMIKVFYDESHYVKMLGKDGALEYMQFSTDDIGDGQEVIVRRETTQDKASRVQEITQRATAGLADPLTVFETLDIPNPKEQARRLVFYNIDPKLYVQQFCVDENTEGAENDPTMKAKQEDKQILNGEEVPPFPKVDQNHIQEHMKFAQTPEFQNADITMQDVFKKHLEGEVAIFKQSYASQQNRNQGTPSNV